MEEKKYTIILPHESIIYLNGVDTLIMYLDLDTLDEIVDFEIRFRNKETMYVVFISEKDDMRKCKATIIDKIKYIQPRCKYGVVIRIKINHNERC